jgi:hypothetical protein
MIQKIQYYLFGIAFLFLFGCAKENPVNNFDGSTPVFSSTFTFDGSTQQVLTAGVESYLFTNYELGTDSVTVYSGTFADPTCYLSNLTVCNRQLDFYLRGFTKSTEARPADFSPTIYQFNSENISFDTMIGQLIPNSNNVDFGTTAIHWTDENGVIWKSDLLPQIDGVFVIESRDAYIPNDRAQKTIKMSVRFKCLLYNNERIAKTLEGTAVIAIGTP